MLAILAIVAMIGLVYASTAGLSTETVRYLASGRSFNSEDLVQISRELDAQAIVYRIDERRRVEVAPSQWQQAQAVVAKLGVGPRSINEIRGEFYNWGFWDSEQDKIRKQQLGHEKLLESMIDSLEGVSWSLVSISRPRSSLTLKPESRSSAFVYLETEDNLELPYRTVESIRTILAKNEADLSPEAITVMDRSGKLYLYGGDARQSAFSRDRAREEQLGQEIHNQIAWIRGVRVAVQLIPSGRDGPPPRSVSRGVPSSLPRSTREFAEHDATPNQAEPFDPNPTGSMIAVNQPLELNDPSPEKRPDGRSTTPQDRNQPGIEETPLGKAPSERGRIWVRVPSSFYYDRFINRNPNAREPSRDELKMHTDRIKEQVETAVRMVVAEPDAWQITVDTIADEVSLGARAPLPTTVDPHSIAFTWAAAVLGVAGLILIVLTIRMRSVRRPEIPRPIERDSRRFLRDTPSEPGPSERVRELVRHNPDAAVSVLRRWVGQGGESS
jgi:flagellar biosynthesis/type III secretory pathway M-ring protein FliF/YscJ